MLLFNLHGSGSCVEGVTVSFLLGGIGPSPTYQQHYFIKQYVACHVTSHQVVIYIYKYEYRGESIDTKIELIGNSKSVQLLNC